MLDRIKVCFTESIQTQIAMAEALPDATSRAAMTLIQSLLNGSKILCYDNGTLAANTQHFAASMINCFETERPSLPAIALNTNNIVLTAIASDRLHDEVCAKQVRALGHADDILLTISTCGNSRDIVKAVGAAVTRDVAIVALTGCDGGGSAGPLEPQDVEIRIPSHHGTRVQEMHILTVNCLCDLIDNTLFPHQDDQGIHMKAFSPLAVIIAALLLQGCVAAAVVGIVAVRTKAATNPRNIGTQVDDETPELRVNTALSKDAQTKKEVRINVSAYQGRVLLVGQSPSSELSTWAKQIAVGVEGTTEVFNEIRQGQPIDLGDTSNGTWVTTKVRSQLLTNDQVKSSNMKVTTENGEVFLLDLVTERETKATASIASRVSGVKRITTAFTFIK